jgi:hypothetical protein
MHANLYSLHCNRSKINPVESKTLATMKVFYQKCWSDACFPLLTGVASVLEKLSFFSQGLEIKLEGIKTERTGMLKYLKYFLVKGSHSEGYRLGNMSGILNRFLAESKILFRVLCNLPGIGKLLPDKLKDSIQPGMDALIPQRVLFPSINFMFYPENNLVAQQKCNACMTKCNDCLLMVLYCPVMYCDHPTNSVDCPLMCTDCLLKCFYRPIKYYDRQTKWMDGLQKTIDCLSKHL